MTVPSNIEKIKAIYQLLFEMATGKLLFSIKEPVQTDDVYDILIKNLQTIAHELKTLVLEVGMVPPYYPYQNITQLLFILDSKHRLLNFNLEVVRLMKYSSVQLLNHSLEDFIDTRSQANWSAIQSELQNNDSFFTSLELVFLTQDQQIVPLYCSISRLIASDFILVTSISTSITPIENKPFGRLPLDNDEVETLQKLHDYILEHLDEPLPTLKELARMFGSEAHKLKVGFRAHYSSSVYHFYHEERLKKAHLLITQTSISLKEVAYLCGFTSYINFYKAFKKYYSYPPSRLSRPDSLR